jgi:hypothetical protein
MAFTDPQTITIDSVDNTLNLVKPGENASRYATADESLSLLISHQETKDRTRRMARVDQRVVAANPLTSVNEFKTLGVYIVIDEPEYGFDDEEIDDVVQGFIAWLSTANVTKMLSHQH